MLSTIRTTKGSQRNYQASAPKTKESEPKPSLSGDKVSLTENSSIGTSIKNGSVNLMKAASRGVGRAASNVGHSVLNTVERLAKDTAIFGVAGAVPAALTCAATAIGGPLAGLAVAATVGVGAGIAHQVMAPENPYDQGLSADNKAYNRGVDSSIVGALALTSGLVGMVTGPFPAAGVALAATTASIYGAIGSVVVQGGEALGLLKKQVA